MPSAHSNIGLAGVLLVAAVAGTAVAQPRTSWRAGTGSWDVSANWTGGEPIAGDLAIIANGGTANIRYPGEICDWLYLPDDVGPSGFAAMHAGSALNTKAVLVGYWGTGAFVQFGGANTMSTGLYVGRWGGTGLYELHGGTLSAAVEDLGLDGGSANFYHYGGTNTVSGTLSIGYGSGGDGLYTLDGGALTATTIDVGVTGTGTLFVPVTSSASIDAGLMTVGPNGLVDVNWVDWFCDHPVDIAGGTVQTGIVWFEAPGGTQMRLSAGTITSHQQRVGMSPGEEGAITQTGGDNDVSYLTVGSMGTGVYDIDDGRLLAWFVSVGSTGEGRFAQTGGACVIDEDLLVGEYVDETGTYTLDGGDLSADHEFIGADGTGTMTQRGGTNSVTSDLYVGYSAGSVGTYSLEGGSLTASTKYVGYNGTGTFVHSGGTNDPTLYLAWGPASDGTYHLSGSGALACDDAFVGYRGAGTFAQTGGAHRVTGSLVLGRHADSSGAYDLGGGGLEVGSLEVGRDGGGLLAITDATADLAVSSKLRLGSDSRFSATEGAVIRMTGATLENESADDEDIAGFNQLTLVFEGGMGGVDPMEIGGRDYGKRWAGFVDNFALAGLTLGGDDVGWVQIVDGFDNQPAWDGTEVQYTERLDVEAGSLLDLNGLTLYYRYGAIHPEATIEYNGGRLVRVCVGDVDDDGAVGFGDILAILSAWGNADGTEDLDGSGTVDFGDLLIVLDSWGPCPE